MTQIFAIFAVLGMACLVWLTYGWMLLPGTCPIHVTVTATGSGDGLEQTIKGLRWLRKNRVWHGNISIQDGGLNHEGLMLALTIARENDIEFCGKNLN